MGTSIGIHYLLDRSWRDYGQISGIVNQKCEKYEMTVNDIDITNPSGKQELTCPNHYILNQRS